MTVGEAENRETMARGGLGKRSERGSLPELIVKLDIFLLRLLFADFFHFFLLFPLSFSLD